LPPPHSKDDDTPAVGITPPGNGDDGRGDDGDEE
jgi:hypothetical protein